MLAIDIRGRKKRKQQETKVKDLTDEFYSKIEQPKDLAPSSEKVKSHKDNNESKVNTNEWTTKHSDYTVKRR